MKKQKNKRPPLIVDDIVINEVLFQRYLNRKKEKKLRQIIDLADLNTRTESELLETLDKMVKAKHFFKYCSSLLININPGPNFVKDYLNLETWIETTQKTKESDWKPHLYSFMHCVYETMRKEKKDQAVNLLGPIGSGKTFNIIHIIEYFCCLNAPKGYEMEIFDKIHRSIQLIHIMGSIYRENNIESTSCGMVCRLGFNNEGVINNFDIEAKILDFTLPFSENGRSFSIFHALMIGMKSDLKRNFYLPEKEQTLNFFRKFTNNFSDSTKQRFKLNDLEIWNRFHSLLKFFQFSKEEVIDILSLLAYILNLNEIVIQKVKQEKNAPEVFTITEGNTSKKLGKNLGIDSEDFVNAFGTFSSSEEIKTFIISMMKKTYYLIFNFILSKTKNFLKSYFINLNRKINHNNVYNGTVINFLDFPGEVEDTTLGGFTTNIANECLNMFAASGYYEVVESILKESVISRQFRPLQSYSVIQTALSDCGIFENLSLPLTDDNFYTLKENAKKKKHLKKCLRFSETQEFSKTNYNFTFQFSHKRISYNYETIYQEAQALTSIERINKIFSLSSNSVIESTYKSSDFVGAQDFYSFYVNTLKKLFLPVKNIKPFVVYCLHSNNSYKIFFNNKKSQRKKVTNEIYNEIPDEATMDIMKNSLAFPILNWSWYGYKEWMLIDDLLKEFGEDFEKVKDKIIMIHNMDEKNKKFTDIPFSKLDKRSKAIYTMSILSRDNDYIIGKKYVMMKKGTLKRIRIYLNSMISTADDLKAKSHLTTNSNNSNRSKGRDFPLIKTYTITGEDNSRANLLKSQCIANVIEKNKVVGRLPQKVKYDIFYFFNLREKQINNYTYPDSDKEENSKANIITKTDYPTYNKLKNILDPRKNKNYNMFDYSENVDKIITLQSNIRALEGRNIYKAKEYLNHQIVLIQSYVRRLITGKKFKKFYDCYNKILLIQRLYKKRYNKMNKNTILIQSYFRKYIMNKRIARKLNEKKKADAKGEYWELDMSSEDGEDVKEADTIGAELEKISDKPSTKDKDNKDSLGGILGNATKTNGRKNKNKETQKMNPSSSKVSRRSGSRSRSKSKSKTQMIQDEKDPNKIIQMILNDQGLERERRNSGLENLYLLYGEGYQKNPKRFYEPNKSNGSRIEDRLIDYGKRKKQKITEEQLDKLKEEEEQMTFKPKITKNPKYNVDDKYPSDFLKRMDYYKLFKERNIENLRNHYKKEKGGDNPFKPKISDFANTIRRNFAMLYNEEQIRKKSEILAKNKERREEEKMREEEEEIKKGKIGRRMQMQLDDANENEMPEFEPNDDAIEIWPRNFDKEYIEKL